MLEVTTSFLLSINSGSGSRILMGQTGNTPLPMTAFTPKKVTHEENTHLSLNNEDHPVINSVKEG
eukprot:8849009-Ditylum_brightwellii.AAC.1